MVKRTETQVRICVYYFGVPVSIWVPLSDTVRLTGRCRRISNRVNPEKEVEFMSTTTHWFRRKQVGRFEWMEPDDFRTVEYFNCDEAPE